MDSNKSKSRDRREDDSKPGTGEELELTPEELKDLDRAQNRVFAEMRRDGMPVFEPDFTKKPLPT